MRETICRNCGAGEGLHKDGTDQCPVGGIEAPIGKKQEWSDTTLDPYDPEDERRVAAMRATLIEVLEDARGKIANMKEVFDKWGWEAFSRDLQKTTDKIVSALAALDKPEPEPARDEAEEIETAFQFSSGRPLPDDLIQKHISAQVHPCGHGLRMVCELCGASCRDRLAGTEARPDQPAQDEAKTPLVNGKPSEIREPVRWFAEQMERKLRAHDADRGPRGWLDKGCDLAYLMGRLLAEAEELRDTPDEDLQAKIDEAADIANFAMMFADMARAALDKG